VKITCMLLPNRANRLQRVWLPYRYVLHPVET
jgi:hypothetical protein